MPGVGGWGAGPGGSRQERGRGTGWEPLVGPLPGLSGVHQAAGQGQVGPPRAPGWAAGPIFKVRKDLSEHL